MTQPHPKQCRRRRVLQEDPFPVISTTETAQIPTEDFLTAFPPPPPRSTLPIPVERPSDPSTVGPKSPHPLRPIQDILNRIAWDTNINQKAKVDTLESLDDSADSNGDRECTYTLGYIDRFSGIQEISLSDWMERRREGTEGEYWVPLHRVMWVRRQLVGSTDEEEEDAQEETVSKDPEGRTQKGESEENDEASSRGVEVIWDRRERIDKVFGSGNTRLNSSTSMEHVNRTLRMEGVSRGVRGTHENDVQQPLRKPS